MEIRFCNLRMNCIIGGFLLVIYYSALSILMYYEIEKSEIILHKDKRGRLSYTKHTSGFWVLGVCFIFMAVDSLALIFGTIMRQDPLIVVFLVCQIIPVFIEFFYLVVALMYGIETEFVFIYLLPFLYLIYVDVVSCFYCRELRKMKRPSSDAIDLEY